MEPFNGLLAAPHIKLMSTLKEFQTNHEQVVWTNSSEIFNKLKQLLCVLDYSFS